MCPSFYEGEVSWNGLLRGKGGEVSLGSFVKGGMFFYWAGEEGGGKEKLGKWFLWESIPWRR